MKTHTQKQIAEMAGITAQYLNFILNKKRNNLSVNVAKKLSEVSQVLGLPFTPEDWMFRPDNIKNFLKGQKST